MHLDVHEVSWSSGWRGLCLLAQGGDPAPSHRGVLGHRLGCGELLVDALERGASALGVIRGLALCLHRFTHGVREVGRQVHEPPGPEQSRRRVDQQDAEGQGLARALGDTAPISVGAVRLERRVRPRLGAEPAPAGAGGSRR